MKGGVIPKDAMKGGMIPLIGAKSTSEDKADHIIFFLFLRLWHVWPDRCVATLHPEKLCVLFLILCPKCTEISRNGKTTFFGDLQTAFPGL